MSDFEKQKKAAAFDRVRDLLSGLPRGEWEGLWKAIAEVSEYQGQTYGSIQTLQEEISKRQEVLKDWQEIALILSTHLATETKEAEESPEQSVEPVEAPSSASQSQTEAESVPEPVDAPGAPEVVTENLSAPAPAPAPAPTVAPTPATDNLSIEGDKNVPDQ